MSKPAPAAPAVDYSKHPVLAWQGQDYGEALALLREVAAGKGEAAEKAGALVARLAPK